MAVVVNGSTAGSTADNRRMMGTIRWMAPEVMYPEKFGFTGNYRKRLPSRSTDIYALSMTILEVSALTPSPLCVEILRISPGRLSRDIPLSATSPQSWPLCAKSWKEASRTDHLQGSRINCGGCWCALGVRSMGPNPPNDRQHPPSSVS